MQQDAEVPERPAFAVSGVADVLDDKLTTHKFEVGQDVRIVSSTDLRLQMKLSRFKVIRLLPETAEGQPEYRIKGEHEAFERLVLERDIAAC
jgi:hypothetical protein